MELHGTHEVGQYMPKAMAAIGTKMHHSASRFAVAASDAAVADDVKPALAALSDVVRQCVACHSGFRLQ
jgi:cytochrome c556